MSKWVWIEIEQAYGCPFCNFSWGELGLFDDEDLDPADEGMQYCPHCRARLDA